MGSKQFSRHALSCAFLMQLKSIPNIGQFHTKNNEHVFGDEYSFGLKVKLYIEQQTIM